MLCFSLCFFPFVLHSDHSVSSLFAAAAIIFSAPPTEWIALSFLSLSGDKILSFQIKHIMINQMSFITLVHLGVCVHVCGNLACAAVLEIHVGGKECVEVGWHGCRCRTG
ncbi:hypothetical protein ATANTOWER_011670 [Ataeniobius toweri]|uniref:Secreted protein n=1 Tax=Ataeniobius toweri TaxID=208326 RepID=A0ABU7CH07_9TELE|nr:hypothetical protein [Ataeniobius toweri]